MRRVLSEACTLLSSNLMKVHYRDRVRHCTNGCMPAACGLIAMLPFVQAVRSQAAATWTGRRRRQNLLRHRCRHPEHVHAGMTPCQPVMMLNWERWPCTVPRGLTYADLGGIEGVLDDIMELIVCPLKHPEVRRAAA